MAPDSGTDPAKPSASKSKPGAAGLTNAIGGMLVGLDEQLLRGQPRAEILVKRSTQLRIERDAGGDLIVDLPEPLERRKPPEPDAPAD